MRRERHSQYEAISSRRAAGDARAIGRQPVSEKMRMINVLLDGWVDDADLDAIERICASVTSDAEMRAIEPRATSLDFGQRTRLRVILSRRL